MPTNTSGQAIVQQITPTPKEEYSQPKIISIPKLNIDAEIEAVGVDEKGNMAVPKDFHNVSWYSPGAKPGELGNAVFAGHLDTVTGAPAIFYEIGSLNIGDEVVIADDNGKEQIFQVVESKLWEYDKLPLNQIFFGKDRRQIVLITCAGTFDKSTKNYSHRRVVFAEKIAQ